jgi:hypothetical protein
MNILMSSLINNIFSNLNNLHNFKKPPSAANSNYQPYKSTHSINRITPGLTQGEKFKTYQNKIVKNLEKRIEYVNSKEGFQTGLPTGLTSQTNDVLRNNDYSSQKHTVDNLKQQYESTLQEYDGLVAKIKGTATNYFDRVNPKNPYLGKNVCLQNGSCGYVTQKGVFKLYPDNDTYTATAGQNGCPNTPYINITGDVMGGGDVNTVGTTISSNPPLIVGTPMTAGQSCGNEGSNVFVNRLISNPTVSYVGCYADNMVSPLMSFIGGAPGSQTTSDTATSGSYTYEQCKEAAINGGYRYFALQGVDYSTSQGYCAVGNNKATSTSLGNSYIITSQTPLWASGTTGDMQGSIAVLNGDGTLVVNNSSGTTIFTTPVPDSVKSQPNPYIGCYTINNSSTDNEIADRYTLTFEQCQDLATDKGYQYFGVGGNNRGDNVKKCLGYNALSDAQESGLSKKCKNQTAGGTGAASIYATDNLNTLGNCYLILQDDGNMCIYNGTGPSDNQGLIWSAGTSGQQQAANPIYAAENGKYGKNWITNDSTLAAGDFVGSTNGNIALIMQTDGNLVLYTFTQSTNCKKMADGNMGAGIGGNALYDIGKVGNLSNLSKTAYIDQDSKLHSIEGFGGSTTSDVSGNIDSNTYDNYDYSEDTDIPDGLANATDVQKQQLDQLQTRLKLLASQLSGYTGNYATGLQETQNQLRANTQGIQNYLHQIGNINNKLQSYDSNIDNILNDSDIVVLQKNYDYLFWSILAAGSVLVAMNVMKK